MGYQTELRNKNRGYMNLIVWQKGIALAKVIYRLTQSLPSAEKFGLVAQMRRAAVSIPSNISEGHAQGHGAYVRHLVIAIGSHAELGTQSEASFRLNYIDGSSRVELETLLGDVGRLTHALLGSVRRSPPDP